MSGNKREQERAELHNTIWALANELRGSVDGWDFKQYVLGMLFYRYISENLTTYLNKGEWDAGNTDFDYAKISDEEALSIRDDMVQEKGFFILPSELFENLLNRIKKADKDAKDQAEKDGKEVEVADLDENLNEILQTTFVAQMTVKTDVEKDWKDFVKKQKEQDLETIIKDEKLKHDEAQKFIENSFRDGEIKTTGTDLDKILPPISRFSGGSNRALKKQTVINKLKDFFEKYFGLV